MTGPAKTTDARAARLADKYIGRDGGNATPRSRFDGHATEAAHLLAAKGKPIEKALRLVAERMPEGWRAFEELCKAVRRDEERANRSDGA